MTPAVPSAVSSERLERALRTLAELVARPGGEVYAPIFERIEAELAARRRNQDTVARARALLAGAGVGAPHHDKGHPAKQG